MAENIHTQNFRRVKSKAHYAQISYGGNTLSAEMFGTEQLSISHTDVIKRRKICMCGNNYVQMCFEKNILCADVFCAFNWFETIQHQPSARRFGEEKLPWFTEAITNDLTNNGDVDDQLKALF